MTNEELVIATERLTPQWLAGFFDGEGTVVAFRRHSKADGIFTIQVALYQSDVKILSLIAMKFPGVFLGPTATKKDARRPVYELRSCGQKTIPFLESIKDHVICKHRQVVAALAIAKMMEGRVGGGSGTDYLSKEERIIREILGNYIIKNNNRIGAKETNAESIS